jgi:hypothetical protein
MSFLLEKTHLYFFRTGRPLRLIFARRSQEWLKMLFFLFYVAFRRVTVLETYSSTTSRSRPRTRGNRSAVLSMHGPETGIIPLRDEIA